MANHFYCSQGAYKKHEQKKTSTFSFLFKNLSSEKDIKHKLM